MLRRVMGLRGDALRASDGEIGTVDDMLFDDDHWTVRYLVAKTGSFLFGRKVLIAPIALGALDWDQHVLNLNLTRDQVEKSPSITTDEPVSRQVETNYYDYFGWPYYWSGMGMYGGIPLYGGMGLSGALMNPGAMSDPLGANEEPQGRNDSTDDEKREQDHGDPHLRSTNEVSSYGIITKEGPFGHVDDFIFDDQTWRIRYLAVDTHVWWPGKKVLLPLDSFGYADWAERKVTMEVTRDQVRDAPEWDPREPISLAFENEVSAYYAGQGREAQMSGAAK